jgi:orotidine-5'-phosphate decarboxylase
MNRNQLFEQISQRKSFLCVGLDTDSTKLPKHLLSHPDPVAEFNRQIVEATADYCVAYKPNLAFYEADGIKGLQSLEATMKYIPDTHFTIADAKRGDIGNTSAMYARSFFGHYGFDSVTVAPYMGSDSVKPFLGYEGKWVIVLALTSNEGAADYQLQRLESGEMLYENVLHTSQQWGNADNMMYVVGATKADKLAHIRSIVPDHFLLVPGVGAQGGSLAEVAKYGMNDHCGLLVNASRSILYASQGEDFAEKAREEAQKLQQEMEMLLDQYC